MKKILILTLSSFACFTSLFAEDSDGLDILGTKIIYDNGSWVNPNETKFNLKKSNTWLKRGYYLEGSSELRKSVLDINWKGLTEASKASKKIPLKDFISIFNLKRAYRSIQEHPEGIIGTTTFALNASSDSVQKIYIIIKSTARTLKLISFGKKKYSEDKF
jgi:hypothetical protein